MEDGVIKFKCNWLNELLGIEVPEELLEWRDKLYSYGLIGVYQDSGVGYGNISIRLPEGMLISGTQTGNIAQLPADKYSLVTEYDMMQNWVSCRGQVKASAESLTHLAFYELDPNINVVVHVHSPEMWERLLHKIPTSSEAVTYGTGAMAEEIKRLHRETAMNEKRIMAMGGHEDGLISFGSNIPDAVDVLLGKV